MKPGPVRVHEPLAWVVDPDNVCELMVNICCGARLELSAHAGTIALVGAGAGRLPSSWVASHPIAQLGVNLRERFIKWKVGAFDAGEPSGLNSAEHPPAGTVRVTDSLPQALRVALLLESPL